MHDVRIGIDVGGTFTDAVALDGATGELCGQVKVPTTHTAVEGVARGIVEALQQLLETAQIPAAAVRFIAHGTTQATNALLEGDVVSVGIVAAGKGVEGMRARTETRVPPIEIAAGKWLRPLHAFAETVAYAEAVRLLRDRGVRVIVAATPFSVDDPTEERSIMDAARAIGLPATGTHEITKLYGLRIRTRTAVVNASILPRMVETADMTERSVRETGIGAPLMIMRCDGGAMSVDEMRRRPILTMLSGPAAGVAGATLYEKVSDGLFLEVGGTSVDISVIRDGRVMVGYAEVGGHKTYVRSLDVRTVGVAGGSMIRTHGGKIAGVGPRSAHIANFPYAVYAEPCEIVSPALETIAPKPGDPEEYAVIRCENGRRYALTLACAANIAGYVHEGQYAFGSREAAERAFAPLAQALGLSVEFAAREVMRAAVERVTPVITGLIEQYRLDRSQAALVGGGGGAATLVPALGEALGMSWRITRDHQVISPIGVALALVREVVERTIPYPGEEDLMRVRREAQDAARRSGAAEGGIDVFVEIDSARGIVRAIATGATELRARQQAPTAVSEAELAAAASRSIGVEQVSLKAHIGGWYIYEGQIEERSLFGLRTRRRVVQRLLDSEGVIRLSRDTMAVQEVTVGQWRPALAAALRAGTAYGDSGGTLPEAYLLCGERIIDLSGVQNQEQALGLAAAELTGYSPETPLAILWVRRKA